MIRWNRRTRQPRSLESNRRDEWTLIHAMCLSVVSMLGVVLLPCVPIQAAEPGSPTHTVQVAVNRVMNILGDPNWQAADRSRDRKRLIVETISDGGRL